MYKRVYKVMLETEDLFHVYEGMTGVWEEDKISFIEQHKALESIANNLTTLDEEHIN